MKKMLLLGGAGFVLSVGVMLFGTPYYSGGKITLMSGDCPKMDMRDHLEGTVVPLPEHPNVRVRVHCTDPIENGPGWGGYSTQKLVLYWAKSEDTNSRWSIGVGKKVELPLDEDTAWFLVPFTVRDGLNSFVGTFVPAARTTRYLQDNGNPEGILSYIGLFSWKGQGQLVFEDAMLVGNYVYVSDVQDQGNGKAIVLYQDMFGPDSRKYTDISLLKHQPMRERAKGSVIVSRQGDRLVAGSRHEN